MTTKLTTTLAWLFLFSTAAAAEMQAHKDIPYTEPKNARQLLDVFAPGGGTGHPVVFWIHGGGWRQGDKAGMQQKPQAFVDKGFVFVSTNYRLAPEVTVKEMTGDIARAIGWVHAHAVDYGGDPDSIIVMGHSAGAHLAALVCTDNSYLKAEGLTLAILKGCVPVDVSVYDIPKRLQESGTTPPETFRRVFGEDEDVYRDLSPITHVSSGRNIPPFLILHVADRPETKTQSHWFAEKLHEAGVQATVVAGEGKTHGTINSDLGRPGDPPTEAVFEFLNEALKGR